MQAKTAACAQAGNGCAVGVFGGQAGAFGIAGGGVALGMGQVGIEPVLALRQSLRMGIDRLNLLQIALLAQQVVPNQQADFADDVQWRSQEQIQRARHHAFGGIFHRHNAKGRAS